MQSPYPIFQNPELPLTSTLESTYTAGWAQKLLTLNPQQRFIPSSIPRIQRLNQLNHSLFKSCNIAVRFMPSNSSSILFPHYSSSGYNLNCGARFKLSVSLLLDTLCECPNRIKIVSNICSLGTQIVFFFLKIKFGSVFQILVIFMLRLKWNGIYIRNLAVSRCVYLVLLSYLMLKIISYTSFFSFLFPSFWCASGR